MIKKLMLILTVVFCLSGSNAFAGYYQFIPSDHDIYDLDHYKYYTWGINWSLPQGEIIESAQLYIKNINNWTVETDALYIHLLDKAYLGLRTYTDNQGGGDNFASWPTAHQLLDVYTDLADMPGPAENYSYYLSNSELNQLASWSQDGRFGLGLDPDCHYFNDGVKFKIKTTTAPVIPEPTTMSLLIPGLLGALKLRKRKA